MATILTLLDVEFRNYSQPTQFSQPTHFFTWAKLSKMNQKLDSESNDMHIMHV